MMDIFTIEWDGTGWAPGALFEDISEMNWVERYATPGSFTLKAPVTKDILQRMQPDTLITHLETNDVMMVENVEIQEDKEKGAKIEVTGRSMWAYLEERAATDHDQGFDPYLTDGSAAGYFITGWPEYTEVSQVRNLIRNGVQEGYTPKDDSNNPLPGFAIPGLEVTYKNGMPAVNVYNSGGWTIDFLAIEREDLLAATIKVLKENRWGLQVLRPYWYSNQTTDIRWELHQGEDRRDDVQFSHDDGDLESAKYFRTNRGQKNALYVASRYWGTYYQAPWQSLNDPFDLRVGFLSAQDLKRNPADEGWGAILAANALTRIFNRRAKAHLRKQEKPLLLEATISKESKLRYGQNYSIGDIVYVNGNYGFSGPMRVVEHVRSFDEDSSESYPVLEFHTDE